MKYASFSGELRTHTSAVGSWKFGAKQAYVGRSEGHCLTVGGKQGDSL